MQRLLVLVIGLLTLFTSCKKNSSSNPNVNQFNLTFNGKSYDVSDNFTLTSAGKIGAISPAGYAMQASVENFLSPPNSLLCNIACNIPGHFQFNFSALSLTDSIKTGKYTVLNSYYLTDSTAGDQVYTIDSTSTLTLTEADSIWVAGTMSFDLTDNSGNHYPGTGNFKITARQ